MNKSPRPERLSLLRSFGDPTSITPTSSSRTMVDWVSTANQRPAWELWGKAKPTGTCPAHPVLCHMADVAAVAGLLVCNVLGERLREQLLSLAPENEELALRRLLFLVALHDLGKGTPAFQCKPEAARAPLIAAGFDLNAKDDARHHGDVGLWFLANALTQIGCAKTAARMLARSVTAHHGEFPTDRSYSKAPDRYEQGESPRWDKARAGMVAEFQRLFGIESFSVSRPNNMFVILLAAYTAVADWIGSMEEVFSYVDPQPSLQSYWPIALDRAAQALSRVGMDSIPPTSLPQTFAGLFSSFSPWPLHLAADRVAAELQSPSLIVVEAPMGEGKTEASLVIASAAAEKFSQTGLFVGLPTQATANQMLGRIQEFLEQTRPNQKSNLLLAHGEAGLNERFQKLSAIYDKGPEDGAVVAERWFLSKKRALLAEHAVGTIDQALLGVLRTAHGFVRLFGLAGKTVILDEVHAYDTYTGELLDRLVEWLAALDTTVVLLSATLPSARRAALVAAYRMGAGVSKKTATAAVPTTAYPRLTVASRAGVQAASFTPRGDAVEVRLEATELEPEALAQTLILQTEHGGCVGLLCNTVDRAQAVCAAVKRLAKFEEVLLIHARMLPTMRSERERLLEQWLGPERRTKLRPHRCIVIGTQVLEQSLDIDFDLMYTELAPIDLLLQRMGRLHRHQRSNRASSHSVPKLVLLRPEGDWATVSVSEIAGVYPEILLRRTMRVLEQRSTLRIPDVIESLIEEVYAMEGVGQDDPLLKHWVQHCAENANQRTSAKVRELPKPTMEDDAFGDFQVYFQDEDDPLKHHDLKAMTRDGDPSVELVCLERAARRLWINGDRTHEVTLGAEPDREMTARLVARSIGVSKKALVRTLLDDDAYQPKAWAKNGLLKYRRLIEFEGGRAVVGDFLLTLDPILGLVITKL